MKTSVKYFAGKVVIISGSSGGIGKAIARMLLKYDARVVINGRNQTKLLGTFNELGGDSTRLLPLCADISKIDEAENLINKTIKFFGRLDILVNNAGVSMRGNLSNLNPKVFEKIFSTNLFGAMNLTIPAIAHLKKTKGHVIFISSLVGIRGLPGLSAYSASKISLRAVAESLRIEESESGIHVGLIQVGFTEIEHDKQVITADGRTQKLNDRSNKMAQTTEQVASNVLKNIKTRRFVTTLTFPGKVMKLLQTLSPSLVEWVLIKNKKTIEKNSS